MKSPTKNGHATYEAVPPGAVGMPADLTTLLSDVATTKAISVFNGASLLRFDGLGTSNRSREGFIPCREGVGSQRGLIIRAAPVRLGPLLPINEERSGVSRPAEPTHARAHRRWIPWTAHAASMSCKPGSRRSARPLFTLNGPLTVEFRFLLLLLSAAVSVPTLSSLSAFTRRCFCTPIRLTILYKP